MPLTLVPPKKGRSEFYRVRGTYHGAYVDRSTKTKDRGKARAFLKSLENKIFRGVISGKAALTFEEAAAAYVIAGHKDRFLNSIVAYLRQRNIAAAEINQAIVDGMAADLFPDASPATRNRQVYTPVLAVLKHVKLAPPITRPIGALGRPRTRFLKADEIERVIVSATAIDSRLGLLFTLLAFTGLRLSEALRLEWADLDIANAQAICGITKNGDPRAIYLPARILTALANSPVERPRIFPWAKSGLLYTMAHMAYEKAGVEHGGAPFHVMRHSYGAAMTRVGADLVGAGVWRSPTAARVYQHFNVNEEARKADLLPGATGTK